MDYIAQLNNFFELSEDFELEANDQLFYLHLLNLFNRSYWQEELRCTDAVLMKKTKIASSRTIAKVKNRLMQTGFIEFHKGKNNATVYSVTELLCHKCKAECKARCKAKCKVTCKVEGKAPLISYTHNIITQKDTRQEDTKTHVRDTGEGVSKGLSEEIKSLFIGFYGSMDWNDEYTLARYEKQYGVEKVKSAIETAIALKHGRDRLLLPYIGGILTNSKGGRKNGNGDYKPKSTVADYDWDRDLPPDLDKYAD